jgi:hypothetical protein
MKSRTILIVAASIGILVSALGVQQYMTSQIASQVGKQIFKADGVTASIPLMEVPGNLLSDSIKSADIKVDSFTLRQNQTRASLELAALQISKEKPRLVGSMEISVIIPTSVIVETSGYPDAKIVGNALQVSAGPAGIGAALLIPKYSNGTLFFELQSLTIFGSKVQGSELPQSLSDQVKKQSMRNFKPPKGVTVKSVTLNNKGLSVKMYGKNVALESFGSNF